MTSSLINVIEYYNGPIITTKHGSTFVSGSLKIIQLDNRMSLDALKQAIGNKISLSNGKVATLQPHMPSIIYYHHRHTHTNMCTHPSPISSRSLNLEGLDEYLDEASNLESRNTANATTRGQVIEGFVKFHRLFLSFRLCIDGFQYCNPMVQVDGTWLYDKYKEIIKLREVHLIGNFTVSLDERWCDRGKLQKLYMPCCHVVAACKHTHHKYKNYIQLVYTLESVSSSNGISPIKHLAKAPGPAYGKTIPHQNVTSNGKDLHQFQTYTYIPCLNAYNFLDVPALMF
ncbi:hypothetical protein JHK85_001223 [Glycine max]|nr:hypothetical protein JHK85_001223 [Glycine max]